MLHDSVVLIKNRADEDGGPKFAAILAVVADLRISIVAVVKRGVDLRQCGGIGAGSHYEMIAPAEHLLAVVSGQRQEAVIGVDNRIAGELCVGKHHRHACPFGGGDERPPAFCIAVI